MKTIVYPGSFDPITIGHYDLINRSTKIFDKIIILVMINKNKNYLFSVEDRTELIKESIKDLKNINNIEIISTDNLLVYWLMKNNRNLVLRGLRTVTDYHYEMQLVYNNKMLWKDIEFLFMVTDIKYSYISSSTVKEILKFDGDISKCIPENIQCSIKNKYKTILINK